MSSVTRTSTKSSKGIPLIVLLPIMVLAGVMAGWLSESDVSISDKLASFSTQTKTVKVKAPAVLTEKEVDHRQYVIRSLEAIERDGIHVVKDSVLCINTGTLDSCEIVVHDISILNKAASDLRKYIKIKNVKVDSVIMGKQIKANREISNLHVMEYKINKKFDL